MTVTVDDHPLVRARILTWEPMQVGQPYIAMIEGAPWVRFTGATVLDAYKRANEWRKDSAAKSLKNPAVVARVEAVAAKRGGKA